MYVTRGEKWLPDHIRASILVLSHDKLEVKENEIPLGGRHQPHGSQLPVLAAPINLQAFDFQNQMSEFLAFSHIKHTKNVEITC